VNFLPRLYDTAKPLQQQSHCTNRDLAKQEATMQQPPATLRSLGIAGENPV